MCRDFPGHRRRRRRRGIICNAPDCLRLTHENETNHRALNTEQIFFLNRVASPPEGGREGFGVLLHWIFNLLSAALANKFRRLFYIFTFFWYFVLIPLLNNKMKMKMKIKKGIDRRESDAGGLQGDPYRDIGRQHELMKLALVGGCSVGS